MFKKKGAGTGLIYAIVDERTDRICYVGKAVDPSSRRSGHITLLENNVHHNPRLQYVFNKLRREGECGLAWLPLEWASVENLGQLEVQWIARLRGLGYDLCNATNGGEGACGRVVSEETKAKMSRANKGKKPTALCIAMAVKANTGRQRTQEERDRRSAALRGNRRGIANLEKRWMEVRANGITDSHKQKLRAAKQAGGVARGERQHLSKLTEADVIQIRNMYDTGLGSRKIGATFGISPQTAWLIKTRKTWAHVA